MKNTAWTRRHFLGTASSFLALGLSGSRARGEDSPKPLKDIFESYVDPVTGARVYDLTPGAWENQVIYQTHSMWTPGMSHLVFMSSRDDDGWTPHAVSLSTGKVQRLIAEKVSPHAMTWSSGLLYFAQSRDIGCIDVIGAYEGRDTQRRVASLPPECLRLEGGLSLGADENVLYAGAVFEEDKRWGVLALDIARGEWRTIAAVDFRVGHVQASPHRADRIMFCWETGGDAPQRTWRVGADGSGLGPFYKETYDEWVTHEAWWGPDRIVFTIWPYDDAHRNLPHGIAWADWESGPEGKMELLTQYPAWHTHGSPDGKWVMGDDFKRNLWLVRVADKQRRLLTQGHLGGEYKTHPHGSFSPDGRYIVFNSSRIKSEHVFMVELPDFDSLKALDEEKQ